jgi:L-threonylcarbamoyladenylate synthase
VITHIHTDIAKAAKALLGGKVVAIPTETVYGLAGNALNDDAVLEIFKAKARPFFDPLIIHVASVTAAEQWVTEMPEAARLLFKTFSPGPLTILLKKKSSISDLVTSGLPDVAVRIPNHPLTLALLEKINIPLAAPSANPFGYISPTSAQHVFDQLQGKIPEILDGGACQVGVESTIVGFENEKIVVYRLGGLAVEDLERVVGKVEVRTHSSSNPKAPGQLKSHYAPRKPMILGEDTDFFFLDKNKKMGVLSFFKTYSDVAQNEVLSPEANLNEAAKNLFAALRRLDNSDIELIFAEILPNQGLGKAINDRLNRAAAKE